MKRIFGFLLVLVSVFTLVACNEKEYKHDGEFTAFEVGASYGKPQVTWVTVTIKDGKVKSFFLDERQSKLDDGFAWNEKTKKELKFDYNMKPASEIEKEWFEQAAAIEAKWLADGADSITTDEDGYIDNIADATMLDTNYSKLAKKALENAKAGKTVAFEVGASYGNPQVTWVEVTFEKGKAKSFFLDERQSKLVDGFAWNEKTKKELKFDYNMKPASEIEKEWFEQAAAIEAKWLADGVDSVSVDADGYIDNIADATMLDTNYSKLAKKALNSVK